METNWNYLYKIWPGLGEAVCTHPESCRGCFFRILVLENWSDFYAWAFLDLYRPFTSFTFPVYIYIYICNFSYKFDTV